jgi:hypothetical protein
MEIRTGSICFLARHPVTSFSSYYCLRTDAEDRPCDNRLWGFGRPRRDYWRLKISGMEGCGVTGGRIVVPSFWIWYDIFRV